MRRAVTIKELEAFGLFADELRKKNPTIPVEAVIQEWLDKPEPPQRFENGWPAPTDSPYDPDIKDYQLRSYCMIGRTYYD